MYREGLRIAYHEAGHAVVQAMIARGRYRVEEVSIAGSRCTGEFMARRGNSLLAGETRLNLFEFGLAVLAGIAAEKHCFSTASPCEEVRLWGAFGDMEEWETACRKIYGDGRRARLYGINVMRKLDEFFGDPEVWRVVERLAGALLEKGTVEGEELRWVLAGLPGGDDGMRYVQGGASPLQGRGD